MPPKERRGTGQNHLFRAPLDQVVDGKHSLAKLARTLDWSFLEKMFGAICTGAPGHRG